MKKRTISKLKSLFGGKAKLKRQLHQPAYGGRAASRTPSPAPSPPTDSYRHLTPSPPPPRAVHPPSPPVPTHPVAPTAPQPAGPQPLLPCAVCGRTFLPESLAKHTNICEKMAVKKRKTFDSSRQRREGTDLEQFLPKNFGLPENSPFLEKSPPHTAKTPARKTQSIRSARTKPSADLSRCPHCARAFGSRAFERHVEWCADKAKILPAAPHQPPREVAEAKNRLAARTQYKAPPVRSRRSLTRDKASNSRSTSVESSTRGASPPPPPPAHPPRDGGDFKYRSRPSEGSFNAEYNEDSLSPHVPVIRHNKRGSGGDPAGDAARARHARLAKDLHSNNSEKLKEDNTINNLDLSGDGTEQRRQINKKVSPKIQRALIKLEKIAGKYSKVKNVVPEQINAENRTIVNEMGSSHEKIEVKNKQKNSTDRKGKRISLIPTRTITKVAVSKTKCNKNASDEIDEIVRSSASKVTICGPNTNDMPSLSKKQHKQIEIDQMSLPYVSRNNKQTEVDINSLPLTSRSTSKFRSTTATKHPDKESKEHTLPPLCNTKSTKNRKFKLEIEKSISTDSLDTIKGYETNFQSVGINTDNKMSCPCVPCVIHTVHDPKKNNSSEITKKQVACNEAVVTRLKPREESVEILFENPSNISSSIMQGDISEYNDSEQTLFKTGISISDVMVKCQSTAEDESEEIDLATDKTSGQTYTKFTDTFNPEADFDEFLNLTDKLIVEHDCTENDVNSEEFVFDLHTPNSESIENFQIEKGDNARLEMPKKIFHSRDESFKESIQELKSQLNEIFIDTKDNIVEHEECNISSMEHVTIYELHTVQTDINPFTGLDVNKPPDILPSITDNNLITSNDKTFKERKNKRSAKNIKYYKLLRDQKKSSKVFQTYILGNEDENSNTDTISVSSEAPPLKLPRIDKATSEVSPLKLPNIDDSRINDDYDPFASAARQMRELMSSDTNIPKKIQTTPKDSTKTLPYIRNNKEKSPPYYARHDYSKTMKDAINKNTQNTPTLQRMKSFDSSNSDYNCVNIFGGRASSFRVNRNEKKSSPKINTSFTKSSKENISMLEKSPFNRTSSLNKSFSSYTGSYSTNKSKEKPVSMSTSLNHSIQRTVRPLNKLAKISKTPIKKEFVNLDAILVDDNSSTTDSHYIDPRLINENDNLPINVNTILNNPDIISSMESLLNTDNLPAKFETFKVEDNKCENNNYEQQSLINENKLQKSADHSPVDNKTKSSSSLTTPTIDDLSTQYDKIMTSLEQSIASKVSVRDDDSLCEDFDLEEFMTSFDEELNKQKAEKRSYSSTTRIVKNYDRSNSNRTSEFNSISSSPIVKANGNGLIPFNKSSSMTFSSNNMTESVFPSSVKRSTSLLDSLPKKGTPPHKIETIQKKRGYKTEEARLEQEIVQSLKEFDKFYENEQVEDWMGNKIDPRSYNRRLSEKSNTTKKESRLKESKPKYEEEHNVQNNHATPNGKSSNDSAYSSLNRISPSKLTICHAKEPPVKSERGTTPLPAGSDSSGSHKEELRAMSSDEFLALERSAEMLDQPLDRVRSIDKEIESYKVDLEKHASGGQRTPSWRSRAELSSSSSESSLPVPPPPPPPHSRSRCATPSALEPRLSRFCHECGSKFHIHTAKFCTECGVKRLSV